MALWLVQLKLLILNFTTLVSLDDHSNDTTLFQMFVLASPFTIMAIVSIGCVMYWHINFATDNMSCQYFTASLFKLVVCQYMFIHLSSQQSILVQSTMLAVQQHISANQCHIAVKRHLNIHQTPSRYAINNHNISGQLFHHYPITNSRSSNSYFLRMLDWLLVLIYKLT